MVEEFGAVTEFRGHLSNTAKDDTGVEATTAAPRCTDKSMCELSGHDLCSGFLCNGTLRCWCLTVTAIAGLGSNESGLDGKLKFKRRLGLQ
ncbi:unnamed protein product [Gongylonema pulchrum]|uniref:EGF-like domain-containing protein n=1 Tax=Gongylonema pulchrum TaxID=637853 RepID=A0A183D3W7_9BILA|nr:unnamed protein product [Gongylonema pulchrum]